MKKLDLKFYSKNETIKQIATLFNQILEESNYNLNAIVKGDGIDLPETVSDKFIANLKDIIECISNEARSIEEETDCWNEFEELDDYDQNEKFIMFLKQCYETVICPIKETEFITKLNFDEFKTVSEYCFKNFILQDGEKKEIDESIINQEDLKILRKAIFTFCDMVVIDNLSKKYTFDNAERMFGFNEEYSEVWWKSVKENENKIWRILMTKRYLNIEDKIDYLIQLMERKKEGLDLW